MVKIKKLFYITFILFSACYYFDSNINNNLNKRYEKGITLFDKQKYAFTHTIAYVIRGFFESSQILENNDFDVYLP